MRLKPTAEQQMLDAVEKCSKSLIEQLLHHGKNQRLMLSDETICHAGGNILKPKLIDTLG